MGTISPFWDYESAANAPASTKAGASAVFDGASVRHPLDRGWMERHCRAFAYVRGR